MTIFHLLYQSTHEVNKLNYLQHTVYEREINTTFKESILEICSVEPQDSGDYLCTASNGVSSTSATNPTNVTVIPGML